MKNNLLFLSTAAVLTLGATTIGTTAQAIEPASSTVTTTLKAPTTIVDPTTPIETPTDGSTGQIGPLTIDVATPLNFGTNEIKSTTQIFQAIPGIDAGTQIEKKLGIQVTDTRGTGAGWKVNVGLSTFAGKKVDNVLKGATLTLPVGTLKTTNEAGNAIAAPTSTAVVLTPGEAGSKPVLSAAVAQGLGTWFSKFDKTATELKIPAGNYADEYSATLTWTLSDTI